MSDIDREMIKLWDARSNTRCPTCSRPTRSEMLHGRDQNQVPRPACRVVLPLLLNRPMRPAVSGNHRPLSSTFSSNWCRQETRRETRNSSCISGSTKYDRRAYRSSTQTFRGQSTHYSIERISSRSWNDDSILSSSSWPPRFRIHVARRRNTNIAAGLATSHFNLI
jgi:hypothetical protein